MISYSTNWMGPVNMKWYYERGLTRKVRKVLEEGRLVYPKGLGPGDVWEYDEITTYYSAGRIDIRDSRKDGYDGWYEYGLSPMHGEDWNDFSGWLDDFKTHDLWELNDLIAEYENVSGKKIRWAEDIHDGRKIS